MQNHIAKPFLHCVKSVQIRSYFWSVVSCIRTEYGDLRSPNTGKCGTPYLDTFDAVLVIHNFRETQVLLLYDSLLKPIKLKVRVRSRDSLKTNYVLVQLFLRNLTHEKFKLKLFFHSVTQKIIGHSNLHWSWLVICKLCQPISVQCSISIPPARKPLIYWRFQGV